MDQVRRLCVVLPPQCGKPRLWLAENQLPGIWLGDFSGDFPRRLAVVAWAALVSVLWGCLGLLRRPISTCKRMEFYSRHEHLVDALVHFLRAAGLRVEK